MNLEIIYLPPLKHLSPFLQIYFWFIYSIAYINTGGDFINVFRQVDRVLKLFAINLDCLLAVGPNSYFMQCYSDFKFIHSRSPVNITTYTHKNTQYIIVDFFIFNWLIGGKRKLTVLVQIGWIMNHFNKSLILNILEARSGWRNYQS